MWVEGQSPLSTNCGRPGLGCRCLNLQPQASAAAQLSALETAGSEPPTVGEKKRKGGKRQRIRCRGRTSHYVSMRLTAVVNPINLEENTSGLTPLKTMLSVEKSLIRAMALKAPKFFSNHSSLLSCGLTQPIQRLHTLGQHKYRRDKQYCMLTNLKI